MLKKLKPRTRRPVPGTAMGLIALVVAVGGVAYAAIPSSSGVFTGCYATTNGLVLNIPHSKGDLRLVEPGEACRSYERKVTWNQEGPPGPPGEPGDSATALWAVINPDGTIAAGSHVVADETFKAQTGNYFVGFDRNISNCASLVTLEEASGSVPFGYIAARPSQSQFQVFTKQYPTTAQADAKLHVAVFC